MDKIDFKNNQEPDLSAETLNQMQTNIENAINDKNIISVGLSENVTLANTGEQKISLSLIRNQIGNKFKLENGKIIVGKGISKVLVSASVCFNFTSNRETSAYNLTIFRNGTENMCQTLNSDANNINDVNRTIHIIPTLLNTKENDTFEMQVYGSKNDIISSYVQRTIMTIEAIS